MKQKNYHISTIYCSNGDIAFVNDRFTHDFQKAKAIMEDEFEDVFSKQIELSVLSINDEDWKIQRTEKSINAKGIFTDEELSIIIEEFTFEN